MICSILMCIVSICKSVTGPQILGNTTDSMIEIPTLQAIKQHTANCTTSHNENKDLSLALGKYLNVLTLLLASVILFLANCSC